MTGGDALDLALLAALLLSAAVGVWRGLTFEVLSLLGWVAAFIAAQLFAADAAALLPLTGASLELNHAAAFAIVFVGVLIVWTLLAKLVRALVRATPLSGLDRLLGALFGLLRGLVLLLALATLVMLTPARGWPGWQQSQLGQALVTALRTLRPLLPSDLAQHLPA